MDKIAAVWSSLVGIKINHNTDDSREVCRYNEDVGIAKKDATFVESRWTGEGEYYVPRSQDDSRHR